MAKIQGTIPHLNTLIMKIKSRFSTERYYTVNDLSNIFTNKWMLHSSYFSEVTCILHFEDIVFTMGGLFHFK